MLIAYQSEDAPWNWHVVDASPDDALPDPSGYHDPGTTFTDMDTCIVFGDNISEDELRAASAWAGHMLEEVLVGFACTEDELGVFGYAHAIDGIDGVRKDWPHARKSGVTTLAEAVHWYNTKSPFAKDPSQE
jgi:hypothetical protein